MRAEEIDSYLCWSWVKVGVMFSCQFFLVKKRETFLENLVNHTQNAEMFTPVLQIDRNICGIGKLQWSNFISQITITADHSVCQKVKKQNKFLS